MAGHEWVTLLGWCALALLVLVLWIRDRWL